MKNWKPFEDWEKLEGKDISFVFRDGGVLKAKVALIDPSIGITIIEKDNIENYIVCLTMPNSPNWNNSYSKEECTLAFNKACEMIDSGVYKAGVIGPLVKNKVNGFPTREDCPF